MPHESLSPQSTQRLQHVDAMRGLMLVMMAVDHIPSDLQIATNHIFGYVSAAAGFVFLSGLMAGRVYSRHRIREGAAACRRKIYARAFTLYKTHLLTFLLVFVGAIGCTLAIGSPPDAAPPLMVNQPWAALAMTPTLLYQPGLLDVLPMYCLFLIGLPALLSALERGRHKRILALSFTGWLLTNLLQPQQPIVAGWINLGAFNFGAWQFVFVSGVVFGFAWAKGKTLLPQPHALVIALMLSLAAWLWAIRHGYAAVPWSHDTFIWLTNKNNVAPLRLLNAATIAYFFAISLQRFPTFFRMPPLALLGRNSLQVFAAHVVIAHAILFLPAQTYATTSSRWISTGVILGAMFFTALICETRRAWRAVETATPHLPPSANQDRLINGASAATSSPP